MKPPSSSVDPGPSDETWRSDPIPFTVRQPSSEAEAEADQLSSKIVAIVVYLILVALIGIPLSRVLGRLDSAARVNALVAGGGLSIVLLGVAAWKEHGPGAR